MKTNDTNKIEESEVLEKILNIGRKIIPRKIFKSAQPIYHYILAVTGTIIYRFPAKKLIVIGVTGTKGKTTTVELVNAILEQAGYKTALASTLHYKIGERHWRNLFKMTLRGRFFTQRFLRQAVNQGCSHAIIEMSSEGVPQFRHKFLYPDALIFTNLAPEHIESHGSYEKYLQAKLSIAKELERMFQKKCSKKNQNKNFDSSSLKGSHGAQNFYSDFSEPAIIANADDKESEKFLALNIKNKVPYSLRDTVGLKADENGSSFQVGKIVIHSKLPGIFNVSNMLGAIAFAKFAGISDEHIKKGLEGINFVRGRMEKINAGQSFDVVIDYAHTPGSLRAAYETYGSTHSNFSGQASSPQAKKYYLICILGNTGGGRDTWKRPEMGKIADEYCDEIILTNEDPYDEDPMKIVEEIKAGITLKPVEIIMDRRAAINKALTLALIETKELALKEKRENESGITKYRVAVLITGKGTDPYIMGPNGAKQEWDDATVAREELNKVLNK